MDIIKYSVVWRGQKEGVRNKANPHNSGTDPFNYVCLNAVAQQESTNNRINVTNGNSKTH